jgi:hypothetical protein
VKLSIGQIQDYLVQAGWPADKIPTAAAVFTFESNGGDPRAHKVDSIERSYGLAQINLGLPGTLLARERASLGTPEDLYDPLYNLQVALNIFHSQGWNAWKNTYVGGRYKKYMKMSSAAWAARTGQDKQQVEQADYDEWTTDLLIAGYTPEEIAQFSSEVSKENSQASLGAIGLIAGLFLLSEVL